MIEYVDFSCSEMLRALSFARDRVKDSHDVFACAILSHGHLGEIIGYDDYPLRLSLCGFIHLSVIQLGSVEGTDFGTTDGMKL